MNGLPYYKAYPRDFLEGTIGMPFEIKCAYRVILDLIYMQGGSLPDDARYISGHLGCSIRKWKSIRNTLVEMGKLTVSGEFLSNYRAEKEVETLAKLQEKQAENRSRPNKNNNLQSPRFNHTEPEPEPDITTLNSAVIARGCDLDLKAIEQKLRQAAKLESSPSPNFMVMSEPINWIENGCDLELDIIPAIKASARGKQISSWAYFRNAVFQARDKRLAPAPEPGTTVRHRTETPNLATIALKAVNR